MNGMVVFCELMEVMLGRDRNVGTWEGRNVGTWERGNVGLNRGAPVLQGCTGSEREEMPLFRPYVPTLLHSYVPLSYSPATIRASSSRHAGTGSGAPPRRSTSSSLDL
jgi:hypothetical protein